MDRIILILVTIATRLHHVISYSCKSEWVPHQGRCLQLSPKPETISDARWRCNKDGGYLAAISDDKSVKELNNALNITLIIIWTEFKLSSTNNGSNTVHVLDKNHNHVTDCSKCNQLKAQFVSSSMTSSCIGMERGVDWILTSCDQKNYFVCESTPVSMFEKLTAKKGMRDYVAIACASFLFVSFVIVVVIGAVWKRFKSINNNSLDRSPVSSVSELNTI